jgi:phage tail sheath protein FI
MPEYLSPGVYVEEVDAGPRPIAGVSTSTAGMVGVTARGPSSGKPQLVTNFLEFQRTFGGFLPDPDPAVASAWDLNAAEGGHWWKFPLSVKGFFDNGGQRLYVKRVVSGGAQVSAAPLGFGLVSQVTRDAATGATELDVAHLVGFAGVGQEIQLCRGDAAPDAEPVQTTSIESYSASGGRIELADPLLQPLSAARGDFVRATGAPSGTAVTFTAVSAGAWGSAVQVNVRPMVGGSLPLLADVDEGASFITRLVEAAAEDSATVTVAPAPGLDPAELPTDGFWVVIGPRQHRVSAAATPEGPIELTFLDTPADHPAWPVGLPVQRVRRAGTAGGTTLRVGGTGRLYPDAIVQLDNGEKIFTRTVQSTAGDEVTFHQPLPTDAELFENDRLSIVESEVSVRYADEAGDTVEERFPNLRLTGDDPNSLARVLSARSQLVRAESGGSLVQVPAGDGQPVYFPATGNGGWAALAGGDDAYGSLSVADFVGVDGGSGARTGIVALEDIDEVAICAVPGMWSGTVQSALIAHCEFLKDRFAVLDPQNGLSIEGIQEFREPFDTSYAALYYPWLNTVHPITSADVEIAPSGHVAGIYARVDVERGVHKAPANAVIRGIRLRDGIAQDVTRRHQDLLNPKGINALRFFPGQGHRVWGARTLSSDSAWRYVNVRRLFLFVEESIDEGTQWVVFEPNGEPLWALVRQTVENFLGTVWRSGALAGTTPEEAFFVACDRTTMTEDDLRGGRLICVVGIAPVYPAEFVIFRIQQKTRETQLA